MKQLWIRWSTKFDALTLRERIVAFAGAALVLISMINLLLLDPLFSRQKQLTQQIRQEQQRIAAMQAEIQAKLKAHSQDPDRDNKERLRGLVEQSAKLRGELEGLQNGLVPPEKMVSLLEDILRQHGRLRLTSLKTLPVAPLNEPVQETAKEGDKDAQAKSAKSTETDSLFKHGVEIVIQGGYTDIVSYLEQLEAMPWQIYWASAKFEAGRYPDATLTLTLFTLSMDKSWLNI